MQHPATPAYAVQWATSSGNLVDLAVPVGMKPAEIWDMARTWADTYQTTAIISEVKNVMWGVRVLARVAVIVCTDNMEFGEVGGIEC